MEEMTGVSEKRKPDSRMFIKAWGLEAGLIFMEMMQKKLDFKRKFKIMVEHDPECESKSVDINVFYLDN